VSFTEKVSGKGKKIRKGNKHIHLWDKKKKMERRKEMTNRGIHLPCNLARKKGGEEKIRRDGRKKGRKKRIAPHW